MSHRRPHLYPLVHDKVILHVTPDLFLLGGISLPPHGPQRPLEQVVHALGGAALHLGQAEENEDHAQVRECEGHNVHTPVAGIFLELVTKLIYTLIHPTSN